MRSREYKDVLGKAKELADRFLEGLHARPVGRPMAIPALLERAGGAMPLRGEDPTSVIEAMSAWADAGLVATAGPRYFGFVIGGSFPAAVAAEWLTSVWDQNAFNYVLSPAAAVAEEIGRRWLVELFGLDEDTSCGFTTGATMANFTALAAARHALLRQSGWDVERQGLFHAPAITVITSEESHVTIFASLQMLGLGRERVIKIPADAQGRMIPEEFNAIVTTTEGPILVCAQAGNVNSGAFDPIGQIASIVHDRKGWLHVDGAFGMWAAASPEHAHLLAGIRQADSITVDGHKWLNVPYDSGFVFVRDHAAHQAAMTLAAPYYGPLTDMARENHSWVKDSSRRARGFAVYAVLRALGRDGLALLVQRCCRLAQKIANLLAETPGILILNEVVLNQVLVRFTPPDGVDADAFTRAVIKRIQEDGTCWTGGTSWQGAHTMRISISNWATTEEDIEMSATAILSCYAQARANHDAAAML